MDGAGGMTAQRRRLRDAAPESQGGVSGPWGTASEPARKLYGENGPIATKAARIRYACELEYFRHTSTA